MIRDAEARLGAHLERTQFDTRFALDQNMRVAVTEVERAAWEDIADLYTQIEQRFLDALSELDEMARGKLKAVPQLRLVESAA